MFKRLKTLTNQIRQSTSASNLAQNWSKFAGVIADLHYRNVRIEDLNTKNKRIRESFASIVTQDKLVPLLLEREETSPTLLYTCYAIVKFHLELGNVENAFLTFKALNEFLYTSELLIVPDGKPGDRGYPKDKNAMANSMLSRDTTLVNTSKQKKSWLRIYNIMLPDEHYTFLRQLRMVENKIPQQYLFDYHIFSIFIF